MNGPRINSDERGITLNKTGSIWAAGAFILAVLGAGWQVSAAFRDTQSGVTALQAELEKMEQDRAIYRRDVENRLRSLELSRAGDDQRLTNALNLLTRIDQRIERIEQRISP